MLNVVLLEVICIFAKKFETWCMRVLLVVIAFLSAMPCMSQHKVTRRGEVMAHGLKFNPELISEDMPEELRLMLQAYKKGSRYAQRLKGAAVAPLLKTNRDQYSPYNNSCPYYIYSDGTVSSTRCVSGCVATSIEQVVSFWRHPQALTDTLFGWETENYSIPDVLPGTAIDWDHIAEDYSAGYTEEQAKAVADLTYYCGVAAHMNWGVESSGASLYRAFEPLWRAFDFKTIAFVQRGLYSNEAWNKLLRNELENGRPICYTGHNMALSGHAFNIDGVDEEGYYHLNWGYGGRYNGYFDLDFLNPFEPMDDATELGRNEGFFSNQTAMFMHPEDFVIDIFDTLGVDKALHSVTVDGVTFRRSPDTQGYVVADFELTNPTDENLNFTFEVLTYLPTDTAIFQQADYVAVTSVNLAPGEHRSWPVYCQFLKYGERVFAISADDETLPFQQPITIEKGTKPQLEYGEVEHQLVRYADDLTATLSLDVSNLAESGYAGDLITFYLVPENSTESLRHWEVLSLPAGETTQLSATFHHLVDGETYTLWVRQPWTIQKEYTFVAKSADATDEVQSVAATKEPAGNAVYDLSGRFRTEARLPKGLYVKHGKKIVVR